MNKIQLAILALLSAAAALNIGCTSTVNSAYNKTARMLTNNNNQEETALYAQVPDVDKEAIVKLNHDLQVHEEASILAKLQEQRDDLQQDRSEYNSERMKFLAEETQNRVHLAKLEAIDRNKLGDKITNIESITDAHLDTLKVQQKRLKLDSKVSILDVEIGKIKVDIASQELKIASLTDNE